MRLIRPDEHKIVWYDYRKPVLPDVDATQRIGTFPKPRGQELSRDVIIASAPKAQSTKQLIWLPVPKVQIKQDLSMPNLIARAATAIPAPPPPVPKKPEKPQVAAPPAPQPNLSAAQPKGDVNRAEEHPVQAVEIPKPRKAFVPPPPVKQEARLTVPVQTADVPMPDASIVGDIQREKRFARWYRDAGILKRYGASAKCASRARSQPRAMPRWT